jgi:hypothetical protein
MPDPRPAGNRHVWLGWLGLFTYALIFLNGLRFAGEFPLPYFVLGSVINAAILTTLILYLRRAYRKR